MDWKLFAQLAVTLAVAVFGGWFGHYLSTRRDLVVERRKIRTAHLIEAYRKIESAACRLDIVPHLAFLESAAADIQLFGSLKEVALIRKLIEELQHQRANPTASERKPVSVNEMLFELRNSLRSELDLEHDPGELREMSFLRLNEVAVGAEDLTSR